MSDPGRDLRLTFFSVYLKKTFPGNFFEKSVFPAHKKHDKNHCNSARILLD
jgi:hypothetical protein